MAKPHRSRRGRCPHRPVGSTTEQRVIHTGPLTGLLGPLGERVPLIRQGLRPATFPVGEGFLPAGEHSSGPFFIFRGPLHTQPCGGTLSKQERAGALIRPELRPVHLPRRGRLPPAGAALMGHWPVLPAGSRPGWRRPLRWRRFSEAPLPILPWAGPGPPGSRSLRRPHRRWP